MLDMEALVHGFLEQGGDRMRTGLPKVPGNPVDLVAYRLFDPADCLDRLAAGGVFF